MTACLPLTIHHSPDKTPCCLHQQDKRSRPCSPSCTMPPLLSPQVAQTTGFWGVGTLGCSHEDVPAGSSTQKPSAETTRPPSSKLGFAGLVFWGRGGIFPIFNPHAFCLELESLFLVQEDKPRGTERPAWPGVTGPRNHRVGRRCSVCHKLSSEEPMAGGLSCASGCRLC